MKKSELLKLAQLSVLKDFTIADGDKLELVNFLEGYRGLELYREKREEEKAGNENGEL